MTTSVHHLQLAPVDPTLWCLVPLSGAGTEITWPTENFRKPEAEAVCGLPVLPLRPCQEQTLGEQLPGAEHSDGAGPWGPVLQEWHAHTLTRSCCGKGKKCPFVELIWGGKEKTDL